MAWLQPDATPHGCGGEVELVGAVCLVPEIGLGVTLGHAVAFHECGSLVETP